MEHFYVSLLLLFVSLVSLSFFIIFYRHRSPFTGPNLPPGKMGFPVIGESLEYLSTGWKGHPEKFFYERMTKYSSKVFKTSLFGKPTVMFCGAACNKYTFWVASCLFMSIDDPNQVAKLAEPFNHLASGILSMPIDLPGTPFNRAIKASKFIREQLLIKIIKQRKVELANGMAKPTQDILSHMLLSCDENGQHMTEHYIADNILGMLVGGHDTTSSTCTFIVKYLAELPQNIYEKVYQEQMAIAKSKAPGELLNWDDIQKMKYSWNVACEVMRLAPPLQGAFREVINDFIFNGFSVPKGWKLYWSASSTHRNPKYFKEPEIFDPSRFEGSGPAPYTYVPFGGGPRMCPGKEYARMEILVFMHNLVKRFKFQTLIPNGKITFNPLPIPPKGLPVRLIPHPA